MASTALFCEWLGVLVDAQGAPLPGVIAALQRFALRQVPVIALDHRLDGTGSLPGVHGPYRPTGERLLLPRPGLLLQAARAQDADLPTSWLVGTSDAHVRAAAQAGCAGCVLIGAALPTDDHGIVVASAADLADAPRVMIPRSGGCWHDHRPS